VSGSQQNCSVACVLFRALVIELRYHTGTISGTRHTMHTLDPAALIGKGLHRECFVHPLDPSLCIKIVVAGNSDENRREAKYYGMLSRRGISWDMLARCHGMVDTNLGCGAVFDLIRDVNGEISLPLSHYLGSSQEGGPSREQLASALAQLRDYLLENRIVTMTLKPRNILYQRLGEGEGGKLVIVDNVGNSDFLPLTNYSGFLARHKILRKWRRFEHLIASQPAR